MEFTTTTKVILVFLTCLVLNESSKIPQYFKRCNRSKPHFRECLVDAVQDALPKITKPVKRLGIPSLAPLEIAEMNIQIGRERTALVQRLKNCRFYGFDNPNKVRNADLDFDQKTLKLEIFFPAVTSSCEYSIDGKILILPIKGEGNCSIDAKNFDVFMNLTYSEVKRDGQAFIEFGNGTIDAILGGMRYQMDNLFNGDKELGDRMNELLNENWQELYEEVKTDYLQVFLQIFIKIANRVFLKVSLEELFDE